MNNKVLMIDNYDSFTYNLVHYLEALGAEVVVHRNDKITVEEAMAFDQIILSPGPGLPKDAGIMQDLIRAAAPTHKILGVCLGHQAIGEVFEGELYNLADVFHGVATPCELKAQDELFAGLPSTFNIGRYHSWSVKAPLPAVLEITAADTASGDIMALKHKTYNVRGVQFHPESILTEHGKEIIKNWLAIPVKG